MTVTDAKTLIDAIRGERLQALWVAALTFGLRRGELLGLRWSDIDFAAKTLTARQTILRVDGRLVFTPPKTDRSRRTGPIAGPTLALLHAHRDRQDQERVKVGTRWKEHGLVFASTIGTPTEPRNLDREWHATRARAACRGCDCMHANQRIMTQGCELELPLVERSATSQRPGPAQRRCEVTRSVR